MSLHESWLATTSSDSTERICTMHSSIIWRISTQRMSMLILFTCRKYDLNNSGRISREELYTVLSKMYRSLSKDDVEDFVRKVDRDRDGMISIDEFMDYFKI